MNNIQNMMNIMMEAERRIRSNEQLTLDELIEVLDGAPHSATIKLGNPHSFRGYYSDLAFEAVESNVGELLNELRNNILNEELIGYKGGEFLMDGDTPLWVANYGETGDKLVGIDDNLCVHTEIDA